MHCSNLPFGAGPYVDECGELSSARPRQYDLEFGELPRLCLGIDAPTVLLHQ